MEINNETLHALGKIGRTGLKIKILANRNVVDISWFDMPDIHLLSVHNTFIVLWLIPS